MASNFDPKENKGLLLKELEERKRLIQYRQNPLKWMHDKMGVRPETIKWSLNEEYGDDFEWDNISEPVTPDPLYKALQGLANREHVAIEAGTGTGKTFLAAHVLFWFLDVYRNRRDPEGKLVEPGGVVICISSKQDQLKKVLWKEIRNHWDTFVSACGHEQAHLLDLQIRMDPSESGQEAWGASGVTASVSAGEKASSKVAGFHQEHQLFILDECTDIHPAIMEAVIHTNLAPNNLILALGNPKSQSDPLHEFATMDDVLHVRASALDHPNIVKNDPEFVVGATTQESIDRRTNKYKVKNHPLILSRVHGVSPKASGRTLFPKEVLNKTKDLVNETDPIKIFNVGNYSKGKFYCYNRPKNDYLNRYIIFADVAGDKALSGDFHAAVCYDRVDRKIVAIIKMRGPRKDYITCLLDMAEEYTIEFGRPIRKHHPLLAFEQNAVGGLHLDPRIEEYPHLFHKRSLQQLNPNERKSVGWDTTSKSRKTMMEELEEWALELYEHPERMQSQELWKEARVFHWNEDAGRQGRYEAERGHHDDLIMATAGALTIDRLIKKKPLDTKRFEPGEEREENPEVLRDFNRGTKKKGMFDVKMGSIKDVDLSNIP